MKIVFRTDASLAIGTGHLARCGMLAARLQRQFSAQVLFVCRDLHTDWASSLREHGFAVAVLENDQPPAPDANGPAHRHWLPVSRITDATDTLAAIRGHGWSEIDWLVVDHYALDAPWESALRTVASRLLAIDDLADREHDVDVLLDQNLRVDEGQAYRMLVPSHARILTGPRYALLGEQFASLEAKEKPAIARRVFVCFGGADEANATGHALAALSEPLLSRLFVDVAIGSKHPQRAQLEAAINRRGNAELHVDTSRVAELMLDADIGVGGGGVMTWERCAAGLASLAWPIATNQRPVLAAAARAGVLLLPDEQAVTSLERLAAQMAAFVDNETLRRNISQTAKKVCDGRGAARLAEVMAAAPRVSLRRATRDDAEQVLAWRNHPSVRRTAFNSETISKEQHARWFETVLADATRDLLIAESHGDALGVVRLDVNGAEAEISIYLASQVQGRGLGKTVLIAAEAWLEDTRPEVHRIIAKVRAGNMSSERIFAQAGYQQDHSVWLRSLDRNREVTK